MNHNRIELLSVLTSPLHEAYPGGINKATNTTMTLKQPVMHNGKLEMVPIYGANGFRGGLRRKAAKRILNYLNRAHGGIPAELWLGLMCGVGPGTPDQSAHTIEEVVRARDHVYMGLFGGGARIHSSMYQASDLVPVIRLTVDNGMVPRWTEEMVCAKPPRDGQVGSEFVSPWELCASRVHFRVDDLYRVFDPAGMLSEIKDAVSSVSKYQAATAQEFADRKQSKEKAKETGEETATKVTVAGMNGVESIAPGVAMYAEFGLDRDAGPHQLGMLLLALSDLLTENSFGGLGRCGFGRMAVKQMRVSYNGQTFKFDNLVDSEGHFKLPEALEPWTRAADEAIANTDLADLAEFFTDFSAGKKAEAKEKAAARKAAKGTT